MATIYRDYGALNGRIAPNNSATFTRKSQVYQATHGGDGNRLPYMNRSFISFTFGGKSIEDFNLIATISGDRLNYNGYAEFEDITSNYDNLDGQQYWATHFNTNTINFNLSTDGIEQRQLDDFLYWFRAGDTKELILAEHPNRAILARVAQPPQLNLLPFEQPVVVTIQNKEYTTSTTLYKGDITLNLVMDDPHWYALTNILGKRDEEHNRYLDQWYDVSVGDWVEVYNSPDALKILYEDGIPLGSMIQQNMLLGNGAYANVLGSDMSRVWAPEESAEQISWYDAQTNTWSTKPADAQGTGARVEADDAAFPYHLGTVAGAVIEASENGIDLSKHDPENDIANVGYFYYSGTAPAPTEIRFTLPLSVDSSGYIDSPANSFAMTEDNKPYNSLFIESRNIQELRFTTPSLFTSYNKAIYIFNTYLGSGTTKGWEDIRQLIRDEVRHIRVREWAIYAINTVTSSNSSVTPVNSQENVKTEMSKFLLRSGDPNIAVGDIYYNPTFYFNSKTGEATGTFGYRLASTPSTFSSNIKENVGDMLLSNYIIIRDRNYPTDSGEITGWNSTHPEYSHRIYHNCTAPLEGLSIEYKNMYL